jgi:Bacterial dnaA protein helix-turn-helix
MTMPLVPVREFDDAKSMIDFYKANGAKFPFAPLPRGAMAKSRCPDYRPIEPSPAPAPASDPKPVIPAEPCKHLSAFFVQKLQITVADAWGIDRKLLLSDSRTTPIVVPRSVAMAIAKRLTPSTLLFLGRQFCRPNGSPRAHTTVLNAIRKYHWLMNELTDALPPDASVWEWAVTARWRLERQSEN